jgi:hypothetical protein
MAHAFMGRHQIVCAILGENGNNTYLSRKGGGLSFGIRKQFIADKEGEGVVPVSLAPQILEDTAQGQILEEGNNNNGLKYSVQNLNELNKAKLTEEMSALLIEYMDHDLMSEEVVIAWANEIEGIEE